MLACADEGVPTVFLDTGPAAALGALQDPAVGERDEQVVLNLGNMHALCFHLRGTQIVSLYEHHTGEVTREQIEDFTERLIAGTLPHEDVFGSKGHGVYYAGEHRSTEDQAAPRRRGHGAAAGEAARVAAGAVLRGAARGHDGVGVLRAAVGVRGEASGVRGRDTASARRCGDSCEHVRPASR